MSCMIRKNFSKKKRQKKNKKTWKYDIFFRCSEKMVFPKKLHWSMIFPISWGNKAFLFPENMVFFYRRKMKDDIFQKIHGNKIWCSLYIGKVGISFSYIYKITLLSKKQRRFYTVKYTYRWHFRHYWKDDIHRRKGDIGNLCTCM